jgi:hypothetical protein
MSNRDWPEDFEHENGNYQCQCTICKEFFIGEKGRVTCKQCYIDYAKHIKNYSDKYFGGN